MTSVKKIGMIGLSLLALAAGAVEVDGIAATVGQTPILRSDVQALMRRRGETEAARYDAYRDELIERTLILKAAEDAKMTMQDWVVEDRIRTIIDNAFGGDRNKLVESLAREKVSYPDWRRRIKEDLVINAMRWNAVYKFVKASPAEMRAEYAAHPERYRADDTVTVSVILLKPSDVAKRAAVEEAIREGSFAEAARRFSADTHAAEGGVWKDVKPSEVFKPQVCNEITRMPVGAVSPWVEIDGWSFLLRKEGENTSRARTFAEAYDDVEANVREAMAKRLAAAWLERLKADTYIRVY